MTSLTGCFCRRPVVVHLRHVDAREGVGRVLWFILLLPDVGCVPFLQLFVVIQLSIFGVRAAVRTLGCNVLRA
jgi:hypothetical protein